MEIVNVMKKIALFLVVVAVAVVFAACQGAVGPKGDTGDTGDTGDPGTAGTPGTPGDRPLITVEGVGRVLLVNDATGGVVGSPITYDMSKEFEGGYGDVTYTPTKTDATDEMYAISHTGSMLTITLARTAPGEYDEPEGGTDLTNVTLGTGAYNAAGLTNADVFEVKIVAKDTEGVTRERYVYAVRNKAPTAPAEDDNDIRNVRLGLLSDKRETDLPHKDYGDGSADAPAWGANDYAWPAEGGSNDFISCTLMNTCKVTPSQSQTDGVANPNFDDEGTLTFTAVTDSANVDVKVADDGAALTLIGKTSTINADGVNRFADQGVTVTVTAMDGGGLTAEKTFRVLVNSPPVAVAGLPTTFTIAKAAEPADLTVQMSAHFKDPEGAPMRYYLAPPFGADYNSRVVVGLTAAGVLTLMDGAYKGSREITVRAYEPADDHEAEAEPAATDLDGVAQWHDITFTVVNENGL